MSENIIEVNHLDHSYGDFQAVDDVCFSVKEGEIFSFLGPNGAGKSTVINILITLLPLRHGSVRIAGFDLAKAPEQVRKFIGIVFQDEPTIGLDTQMRMRLWDYIKKVNDSGTTIFLTTHYMDEADQVSDWTDIIDHGKVIAAGTPEKLKDNLGQDMIYLETLNDDASLRLLRELEVVKVANRSTKGLVVTIDADGPHCLPTIMETLKEQGIHLTSVNLKKPTLDDVFVHYLPFLGAGVIALTTLFTSLFGGISLLFDENWGLLR